MSDKSAIEWTDATWNPVTGCSKVSPGCANCYAEKISLRFGHSKLPWTPENASENVVLHPERLDQPLRWRRPRMVFVNSMSDLFYEEIPATFVWRVFDTMRLAPRHTFQVLTKRPERAAELVAEYYRYTTRANPLGGEVEYPLPNVWLGVSIENSRFTWRADVLREIPAAVRFISAEPLLGSLFPAGGVEPEVVHDQGREDGACASSTLAAGRSSGASRAPLDLTGINWLIVGGESGGRDARPMHPDWARQIRDACVLEGLHDDYRPGRDRPAFFFKQWGSWRPCALGLDDYERGREHTNCSAHCTDGMFYAGASPKSGGRLLDGREWNEMPETRQAVAA